MEKAGMINVYTCEFGHRMVTMNIDSGVTYFMVPCPFKCEGTAKSCFYRCDQTLPHDHEWYRHSGKRLSDDDKEHHKKGGLFLRGRTKANIDRELLLHVERMPEAERLAFRTRLKVNPEAAKRQLEDFIRRTL